MSTTTASVPVTAPAPASIAQANGKRVQRAKQVDANGKFFDDKVHEVDFAKWTRDCKAPGTRKPANLTIHIKTRRDKNRPWENQCECESAQGRMRWTC